MFFGLKFGESIEHLSRVRSSGVLGRSPLAMLPSTSPPIQRIPVRRIGGRRKFKTNTFRPRMSGAVESTTAEAGAGGNKEKKKQEEENILCRGEFV